MDRIAEFLDKVPFLRGRVVEGDAPGSGVGPIKIRHGLGYEYTGFIPLNGAFLFEDNSNPQKDQEIWLQYAVHGSVTATLDKARIWVF